MTTNKMFGLAYGVMVTVTVAGLFLTGGNNSSSAISEPVTLVPAEVRLDLEGGGVCSGTFIGPHAILTAEHCVTGGPTTITVTGEAANIREIVLDGLDHAIVYVDLMRISWAEVDATPMQVGDSIHWTGNPGGMWMLYRKGYVSAVNYQERGETYMLIDALALFGDSGSGIYDAKGKVRGVLSFVLAPEGFQWYDWLMVGVYPFGFSKAQWDRATFVDGGV